LRRPYRFSTVVLSTAITPSSPTAVPACRARAPAIAPNTATQSWRRLAANRARRRWLSTAVHPSARHSPSAGTPVRTATAWTEAAPSTGSATSANSSSGPPTPRQRTPAAATASPPSALHVRASSSTPPSADGARPGGGPTALGAPATRLSGTLVMACLHRGGLRFDTHNPTRGARLLFRQHRYPLPEQKCLTPTRGTGYECVSDGRGENSSP